MIYKSLQDMIEYHIYYKEIKIDDEVIMRIWLNKDDYTNEYFFTVKLGRGKE